MNKVPVFLHSTTVFDHIALAVTGRRIAQIDKVRSGTLRLTADPAP
jgi:hypothetical protein